MTAGRSNAESAPLPAPPSTRVTKRVAVLQSNYVPWKGYFDIVNDVDEFVFYDDVQFTKNDWRNRNLIKTAAGPKWISIPVGTRLDRLICEVELPDPSWAVRHWRQLQESYRRAPFLGHYRPFFEDVYLGRRWRLLSELNQYLVRAIASDLLGVRTTFTDSRAYGATGERLDRLVDIVRKAGATTYVSGPSAKAYVDPQRFADSGVHLVWKDYDGYPEYPQLHPPFTHRVSVLDLLFNVGPEAPRYIWGWR
jgi:hypothetical protein